jgi:hypothetical protein
MDRAPLPNDGSDEPAEEPDDLSALDFGPPADPDDDTDGSGLDAFDAFSVDDDEPAEPVVAPFTVSNPPGTVTVSAHLDGRVHRIELSPKVTTMTESDLAEEIVLIAGLATQHARSAQYQSILDGMTAQGHDGADTREFLSRDLKLPSPQQAESATAELFSTRYAHE